MRCLIVDSFTDEAFKGNPAGVCLTTGELAPTRMLAIAQELNLSETAFVGPPQPDGHRPIRYFSPKMEIPLCGHATLASAKVLLSEAHLPATDVVEFRTIEDLTLRVSRHRRGLEMQFPIYDTVPTDAPPPLLAALGLNGCVNAAYNDETNILLVEIEDPAELRDLAPDFAALVASHQGINGVLVTAPANGPAHDFHSRYFWPWSGTNEDPVTGGTHTFLAKYWSERLGKTRLSSFQSSARTGSMEVELVRDTLIIRSDAVIVFDGTLTLPS